MIPKPPVPRKKRRRVTAELTAYCEKCGRTDLAIERHHKLFRSRGGKDKAENIVCLCLCCHKEAHGERVVRHEDLV